MEWKCHQAKIIKPLGGSGNAWLVHRNRRFKGWVILDPSGPDGSSLTIESRWKVLLFPVASTWAWCWCFSMLPAAFLHSSWEQSLEAWLTFPRPHVNSGIGSSIRDICMRFRRWKRRHHYCFGHSKTQRVFGR